MTEQLNIYPFPPTSTLTNNCLQVCRSAAAVSAVAKASIEQGPPVFLKDDSFEANRSPGQETDFPANDLPTANKIARLVTWLNQRWPQGCPHKVMVNLRGSANFFREDDGQDSILIFCLHLSLFYRPRKRQGPAENAQAPLHVQQ